ncbi:MAG: hypothetical protein GY944_29800, partial [bacterium]|nr:hypothetical protein [bacterium]
ELKRARDQLRDPVQILDALLQDGSELSRYTQAMATVAAAGGGLVTAPAVPEAPPWLTLDALREDQASIQERTSELDERLRAGLEHAEQLPPPEPTTPEQVEQALQQERTLEQIAAASPFITEGAQAFDAAGVALGIDDAREAAVEQMRALAALAEARERFLDLRRLIEVATADQQRLQQVFDPEDPEAGAQLLANRLELLPALREVQSRNLVRSERLGELIEEERALLPGADALASADEEEAARVEQERERLEVADQILLVTASSMEGVIAGLAETGHTDWQPEAVAGEQAVRGLENLRRLFFSLIEMLRDTARREVELADDTEQVAALEQDDRAHRLGPLVPRQGELAEITGTIANALEEQSRQQPIDLAAPADPSTDPEARQQAEQLRRAAELVLAAQIEMEGGGENLAAEPTDFAQARVHQDQAVEHLREALELLTPPDQQENQDQQQDQQQQEEQQQEQQQEQQGEQPQAEPQPRPEDADPSQLLQEVRDREAERRRENAERKRRGFDTVERDW